MAEKLIIKISGNVSEFQNALKETKKQTEGLEKGLASAAKISGAAFAALTGVIGGTVVAFANFEKSGATVRTLLDETSFAGKNLNDGFKDLQKGVLEVGKSTGQSFDSLNNALFGLISSGVAAGDSIEALNAAAQLAEVGSTSVDAAVQALTATITAYGSEAGSATEIAEKFFTAQKFGNTTVEALANNFNKVAGISKELSQGFEETLAAATALTNNGVVPTEQAFTQLSAVYTSVLSAGEKLKTATPEVASAFSLANVESKGLVVALKETQDALGGDVQAFQKLLGSAEALKAALALTGSQSESYSKILKAMQDDAERAANFQARLSEISEITAKRFERLKNEALAVAISLGEKFAPTINKVIDAISSLFQLISDNPLATEFAAGIIAVGTAVSGLILILTTLGIVILKVRTTAIALNLAFQLTTKATVLWNTVTKAAATVQAILTKRITITTIAQKALAIGTKIAAFGFKALRIAIAAALGPFGLIFIAITTLAVIFRKEIAEFVIPLWEKLVKGFEIAGPIARAALIAIGAEISAFVSNAGKALGGLGTLLVGVFTLDVNKIKQGFEALKTGTVDAFSNIGQAAGSTFNAALKSELDKVDEAAAAEKRAKEIAAARAKIEKESLEKSAADELALKKKLEDDKLAASKAAQQKVDDDLKERQDKRALLQKKQIEILQLEDENASKTLIDLKKNEIDLITAIETEKNVKIKEILVGRLEENLRLQKEFDAEDAVRRTILKDKILKDNQLFNELTAEQQEQFLNERAESITTRQEAEKEVRDELLQDEIDKRQKAQKRILKDQKQFGDTFAEINKVINSEQVQGTKSAAGELVSLSRSTNTTLAAIGKAAAITQITIGTAESAMNIFKGFSKIPIIGIGLGIAGAAAAVAFGAERIGQVVGAQEGGLITGGIQGVDSVPALLAPGELVTPARNFDEVVNSVAQSRSEGLGGGATGGDSTTEVVIGFTDDAFEIIEQKLLERRAIGTGSF